MKPSLQELLSLLQDFLKCLTDSRETSFSPSKGKHLSIYIALSIYYTNLCQGKTFKSLAELWQVVVGY